MPPRPIDSDCRKQPEMTRQKTEKHHAKHRNRVRIIGGSCRGRQLVFTDAAGLRPTADSVRERLFNWLGQDLSGLAVLDLFAGSGALGFEAASRNAQSVCLCEIQAQTAAALQRQAQEFGLQNRLQVVRQDALSFLQQSRLKFDVVFLDPPFGWAKWPELFKALENRLADQAAVYIEAEALPPLPPYLEVRREGRAGKSVFALARQPEIGN